jgi:HK97 family phage major capsid protein
MANKAAELRQKRHAALEAGRAILTKADDEKRTLNTEERPAWDKSWAEAEDLRVQIEDQERRDNLARADGEMEFRKKEDSKKEEKKPTSRRPWDIDEYRTAFDAYLTGKPTGDEERVLQAGIGTLGGYLYAPETFLDELIKNVTNATIFRSMARVLPPLLGADSIGVPVLTDRMSAAAWTSELGAPSTDTALAFGKRALTPHPLAKEVPVSKLLLRRVPSAVSLVQSELSRVVAEAMENAYMTGTGFQQPLGIFTASNDGISTARDVSTGNTSTAVTFDGLKSAKYTLKQAYWGRAEWIMHRDGMQAIAKLKDGEGRYLLQDGVVRGDFAGGQNGTAGPDSLVGFPVRLSEYAPNTFSTLKYVAILGDFNSAYWIIDSVDSQIQRLEELRARTNQDLFIIRMMTDGAPVLEEAVVRVKLA